MIRDWSNLAEPPFAAAEASRWIAVLPLGATEQHGPHLPLETDTLIGEAYLARVRTLLPEHLHVAVMPVQPIGISTEHIDFPGTQTIAPEKALRDWLAIGEAVARAGVPKLVIVTSHGGNSAMMSVVAQELRARQKLLVVTASWSRFGTPPGLFSESELRHGIHAGAVETSIMLAAWPDRVRRDRLQNFEPLSVAMDRDFRWLNTQRPTPFAWQMQDLHESGAAGDSTAGNPKKGEALLGYGAAGFCDLLVEIDRFNLPQQVK